jgi:glutamate-1-semialdehyde 2,1-aminomutase
MLTVFFGPSQVTNYDEATTADTQRFARFFRAALDQSLWIPPSQFESWFVSVVHSQADIDATVEAVERALLASD